MKSLARTDNSAQTAIIWALFIALETLAQLTLKMAAMDPDPWLRLPDTFTKFAGSPWFAASIACDAANLLLWLAILRRHELSTAVPLSSATYLTILGATWALFKEPIAMPQLIGILLIVAGLILVAPHGAEDRED